MRLFTVSTARLLVASLGAFGLASSGSAAPFDGQADHSTTSLGTYHVITGGKFPTGTTPNGDNGSGGTFRYLYDGPSAPAKQWNKDDWFSSQSGLALTLKNNGSIVYDNNGIEDGTYGNFYNAVAQGTASNSTPGLYRGYSMSNNDDLIWSGYFKIETETTVDQIIGYFDEYQGFDRNNPNVGYRVNIWSNVAGNLLPVDTGGFDGDVLASDGLGGTFSTSDTGVDRVFDTGATDDILRLTYTLAEPITFQPGVYWFSHDATVPEPATLALAALGSAALLLRRRRS